MNFQSLFTIYTLLYLANAAPLPLPIPEPNPVVVTTVIPVAEVIVGDGYTTTRQLTTLATTNPDLLMDSNTQTITTITDLVNNDKVANANVVVTDAPTSTAEPYNDDVGILNIKVSINEVLMVDGNGNPVSTKQNTVTKSEVIYSDTTVPYVDGQLVGYTLTSADIENTLTPTPTQTPAPTSTPTTAPTTASTTETTPTSSDEQSTSTSETTSSPTSTSTTEDSNTTSSEESDSSNTSEFVNFVTTWKNGEVFYSSLPMTLVQPTNVAPIVALTTTTLANPNDATPTTGIISLVSSDGSLLLGTLTENLPKDKNVAVTMLDPATVSVTNTKAITTPTSFPTKTPTTSTAASNPTGLLQDDSSSSENTDTSTVDTSKYLSKSPNAIVYSPYNNDGSCKSYDSVLQDLQLIHSKNIGEIRVYGNDCNYMTTVLKISKDLGIQVNQGFWISASGVDSIDDAVDNLITYVSSGAGGYGWEIFSYFTVGNEAIISNFCTVDQLISKISEVKGKLQSAGYTGKITTSEPPVSFENHPELCTGSEIDFVGINPHSYFDVYSAPDQAGSFVAGQIDIVRQYCGSLDIVVTETGYPHAGNVNGKNVPSPDNQRIALQSIFDVVGTDVTILTTFDDFWKSPGQYNIEQYFGMIDLLQ